MIIPMNIRALIADDGPAWWHIRVASLTIDPLAFGKTLEEQLAMTLEEQLAMTLEEQLAMTLEEAICRFRDVPADGVYLGAFVDNALIGMVTFLRDEGSKERHKGHIYGMFCHPNIDAPALVVRLSPRLSSTSAALQRSNRYCSQ
jgi:hypothetical protein